MHGVLRLLVPGMNSKRKYFIGSLQCLGEWSTYFYLSFEELQNKPVASAPIHLIENQGSFLVDFHYSM